MSAANEYLPAVESVITGFRMTAQEMIEREAGIGGDGHPVEQETALTIRQPDDLLAMQFDDSDRILGDRLLAKGQSLVIAGAGSIGKSRLLLQLAVAVITGRQWLGFETCGHELTWLILQAESFRPRARAAMEVQREREARRRPCLLRRVGRREGVSADVARWHLCPRSDPAPITKYGPAAMLFSERASRQARL